MKFHVPDMSCGHCTAAITREITALDPQAQVAADLQAHTVEVTSAQPSSAIVDAIIAAGYDAAAIA